MKNVFRLILVLTVSTIIWACEDNIIDTGNNFDIKLKNTETYLYDFHISGDEEGATIITQATHFETSELKRDSSTNWSVVYQYKPETGFLGLDSVEIETCTGDDGTNCGVVDTVKFVFNITN